MDEETLRAYYRTVCRDHRCPKCGAAIHLVDKSTMTGTEMREFSCTACDWNDVLDYGPALWKLLSDAKKGDPHPPGGE